MKKIYSFALAAVAILSAASCQKELVNDENLLGGGNFTVTAVASADSKAVLDGVNTYWTPGDKIVVYDATGAEATFSTDITEKAASAKFTSEAEFNAPESLVAVYPKRTDRGATSYADGVISGLHIGGGQTAVAGSFDPLYAVSVGTPKAEGSTELVFNAAHCLVKFTVGGETAPTKVTLKNNGERLIAGIYNYTLATGIAEVTGGAKEISLTGNFEVGKTYYIAMTHGICGNGISLLYDDVEMKNTGTTFTAEANKIYDLGTLPAAEEPEGFKAGDYWIVSEGNYALPVTGKNYDYLQVDVRGYTDNVFKFTEVEGGYTIQQADGKYLYKNNDSYNNFNVSTQLPEAGHVWTVVDNNDGTFTITNVLSSKYIQYSTKYISYGAYIDEQGQYPQLVDASSATVRPILSVSSKMIAVAADATQCTFDIISNQSWTLSAGEGVTLDKLNGEGDATVMVSFAANDGNTAREYTVTVSSVEFEDIVVKVSQAGVSSGELGEPSTTACYTLSTESITGSNNGYANNCDIEVEGVTWNVTGNSTTNPWRIGGKNITNQDRTVYSKTAYPFALSKVEFVSGTSTVTSWNSLKLEYSTNSDFTDAKTIEASEVGADKTISFVSADGFPANCYYRFVLNVTVSGNSSNKYVQLKNIIFYGYK